MVTWGCYTFRLSLLYLLIPAAVSFHHSLLCSDPLTPLLNSSEVVRRVDRSPYRLHVTKHISNTTHAGSEQYKVEISSSNPLLKFATAQIAIVKTDACGYGELSYKSSEFYKEEPTSRLCPIVFLTKTQEKMQTSPSLLWNPPSCGCVQFRGTVFEDYKGGYYRDKNSLSNGQLTFTVCVKKREDRQQYINALCRIRGRYSAAEIVSRDAFKVRHGLRDAVLDMRNLVGAYEDRLNKIDECCNKGTDHEQGRCLSLTRYHRVDRLCEDGIPDIAITALRRAHTRSRERKCCFIMGSHRYTCFNHKSAFPINSTEAGILDYSRDETDPLNDLSDIATHQDVDVLSMLYQLEFGAEFKSAENENVNMRDIGSKKVSSEEKSSRGSRENIDSRRPLSDSAIPPMKAIKPVGDKNLDVLRKTTEVNAYSSGNKVSRESRRGRGRKRGRISWRRRNSGLRRRSNKASRDSRRRGNYRGRPGSRERKWKGQSRSSAQQFHRQKQPKAASVGLEGGISSAEMIQERLDKKAKRIRVRRVCCGRGTDFGHKIFTVDPMKGREECNVGADSLSIAMTEAHNDRVGNMCWRQFIMCCDVAFLSHSRRTTKHRGAARETIDDEEDRLDMGEEVDRSDQEGEAMYQIMRTPARQPGKDDEEDKDGPQYFDEADNNRVDEKSGDMDKKEYRKIADKALSVDTSGVGSRVAVEEIEESDERVFAASGEEDDEDSEEDDFDSEQDEADDEDIEEEEKLPKPASRRQSKGGYSKQRLGYRQRNSKGQRSSWAQSSRNRNRSNVSRGRHRFWKGRKNSRGRDSRQNKSRGSGYRSLPERQGGKSRKGRGRNSARSGRRASGVNSRSYDRWRDRGYMSDDDGRYGNFGMEGQYQESQRRRTTLDSKEQARKNRQRMNGFDLVRDYYRNK